VPVKDGPVSLPTVTLPRILAKSLVVASRQLAEDDARLRHAEIALPWV
jgi:hypothetical protein